jgi:hypothetical protein
MGLGDALPCSPNSNLIETLISVPSPPELRVAEAAADGVRICWCGGATMMPHALSHGFHTLIWVMPCHALLRSRRRAAVRIEVSHLRRGSLGSSAIPILQYQVQCRAPPPADLADLAEHGWANVQTGGCDLAGLTSADEVRTPPRSLPRLLIPATQPPLLLL